MRQPPLVDPPQLLFLHATGFNAQTYAPLLALLPDSVHAQAWDLRGHGRNPLAADPAMLTGWDFYARDVIAELDANPGWPPLVLAGHSMGAVVSLLVAAARPARVRAVVMIDPPLFPPRWRCYTYLPGVRALLRTRLPIAARAGKRRAAFPDAAEALAAYRGRGAFASWQPGFLEAYLDGGLVDTPDGGVTLACTPAWEQATFAACRHNPWAALRQLAVPLTVLIAEQRSTASGKLGRLRRCCPGATIQIVPGSSHFIPMEYPQIVADVLAAACA